MHAQNKGSFGEANGRFKHGGKGEKLYEVWCSMRARCNRKADKRYAVYGGKGVKVCEEWNDYGAFRTWALNSGYQIGLTIDRINNDGNYEPSNCRWATYKMQANNQQNTVFITYRGFRKSLHEWADFLGISANTLYSRYVLNRWSPERALFEGIKRGAHTQAALEKMKEGKENDG